MKKPVTFIVIAALIVIFAGNSGCICSRTNEQILGDIAQRVSSNRQLAILSDTEYEFITTDSLREQLVEQFDAENGREEIESDEDLLQIMGLLDGEDDLYDILLDLYSEQVAGYYDMQTKQIFVISDGGSLSISERMTFAHEFTHALQDQHYDLEALDTLAGYDSEYSMGITSLIEGDAMLTQYNYFSEALSQYEQSLYIQELAQGNNTTYDNAPRYLQESLVFPYTYGYEFVHYLYERGGWPAVNAAYDNPPKSMEQIIHPEKYEMDDDPIVVNLPDMPDLLGEGWHIVEDGTVGEFDLRMTLEAFITPSEDTQSAAAGWGGDAYAFCENDETEEQLLVIYSRWDSEPEAKEFFDTYSESRSDETWSSGTSQANINTWQSNNRHLYIEKSSDCILLINAPDSALAVTVRNGILI